MDIEYVTKIQKWVEYDNIVTKYKDDMKVYIDKRKDVEDEILDYIESNKYDKLTVNISDGNIKFSKKNTTQQLSMTVLRGILEAYNKTYKDTIDINGLMGFIKDSLEVKSKICMHREIKY